MELDDSGSKDINLLDPGYIYLVFILKLLIHVSRVFHNCYFQL